MILFVESKNFDNVIDQYKNIEKGSKSAEDKLAKASSYDKAPAKIIKQCNKIKNALNTYTSTIKKRKNTFTDKQETFEKAVANIKQVFETFNADTQASQAVSSTSADMEGKALGTGIFKDYIIKEEDLPKVWKATAIDTVLNDLTAEQYAAIVEVAKTLIGKYNMDAALAVKISDYMVSVALPIFESTIYKMVQVYLNSPERFEVDLNMPMYLEDGLGQAELNTIGILADMVQFEYGGELIDISEAFNEAYNAMQSGLAQSAEAWNAFIESKNIGTIRKIKLAETESFSSSSLPEYSTSGLSDILKQAELNNVTPRIALSPKDGISLIGKNDSGNIEVTLEDPMTFAVLASDDNGFEVFGWGNFYYVRFEDMEIDRTQFDLYYTA